MASQQQPGSPEQMVDVTASEWLMIIITGFTGLFLGPMALIPGAVVVGMFAYRVNPELMRKTAAATWIRGLLPAPTNQEDAVPATGVTVNKVPLSKIIVSKGTTSTKALAMIDLATLARCSTLLLVGSRGSGKSTLLRALLSARKDAIMVYDPHASPSDWPMATMVHNSETSISNGLASAYKRLQVRKEERRKGIRTSDWPSICLAADEWGAIVSSVTLPKAIDRTPGEVSTELMKEGRKFGIGFVAGAHGKTNASLGCTGDQEAFIQSFDWIVNMGGFTRKMLAKEYGELVDQIPMGTNEQGGTFPLIVVCESPTTGELRLLDMRGLEKIVDSTSKPSRTSASTQPDDRLLAGLLRTVQSTLNVQQQPERSDTVQARSDAVHDRSGVQPKGAERAKTEASEGAERSESLSSEELRRLVKAVELFKLNGSKQRAIETAFECKKGGSSIWKRASFLFDRAVADEEASSPNSGEEPPEWFGKAFGE